MDTACRHLVRIMKAYQSVGGANLHDIVEELTELPPRISILDVIDECRRRGWIVGSAMAPWLTNEGKKEADNFEHVAFP